MTSAGNPQRNHYQRSLQKLRLRLAQAYDNATKILAEFDAEIFVRSPHSLYLWAALPFKDFNPASIG